MTYMNGVNRQYNAANQMTNDGTNTLTYDNNGNLTAVGADSYTWDRANRLLSHGGISYAYDGAGNRISQNTLKYLLDVQPGLTVVLGDSDGNHFVHAVRGIHAQEDNLGNWEYMAQDGLGSVRGLLDDATVVQSSMSYDPYGVPDTTVNGFAYTSEMRDSNGLQYHRARYYDPALGVWTTQDFLETVNRYSYVGSNPINYFDDNGLQRKGDEGAGGTGGAGGGVIYTAEGAMSLNDYISTYGTVTIRQGNIYSSNGEYLGSYTYNGVQRSLLDPQIGSVYEVGGANDSRIATYSGNIPQYGPGPVVIGRQMQEAYKICQVLNSGLCNMSFPDGYGMSFPDSTVMSLSSNQSSISISPSSNLQNQTRTNEDEPKRCFPSEVIAWMSSFSTRDTNSTTPAWSAYQYKVAGAKEYNVEHNGVTVRADGIRPEDCSFLEAKYIANPNYSAYVPGTISGRDSYVLGVQGQTLDTISRYSAIINDPTSPMVRLEIITNHDEARLFLLHMLGATPGTVRIKQ